MINTQQFLDGFETENKDRISIIRPKSRHMYVRATLVEIKDGSIVEVDMGGPDDDRPTKRERVQGWLLVASIVVLALFSAWLVVPQ